MSPDRATRVLTVLGALALSSCAPGSSLIPPVDDSPNSAHSARPPVGAPILREECSENGASACADADFDGPSILRCLGKSWTLETVCRTACESAGQCSAGCAVVRGESSPRCLCAPMGPNCPGSTHCESHHTLNVSTDAGETTTIDCLATCSEAPGGFSLGCGFSRDSGVAGCLCGALGDACEPDQEARACVGASVPPTGDVDSATTEIARCEAGVWSALTCASICSGADAQCWRRKGGPDVCSCEA